MQEDHCPEGEVAADREELAVGHVDHVEHAEDQAEPDGEQRIEPAQHHALDEEFEQRLEHGGVRRALTGIPPHSGPLPQ